MSRSGYDYDCDDPLAYGRWRAHVASATRGKRGQRLLRDMLAALDAMADKRLVAHELEVSSEADAKNAAAWASITLRDPSEYPGWRRPDNVRDGDVCALGSVGKMRGLDMSSLDPHDPDTVASAFDCAAQLAREVTYINDECGPYGETPEQRFARVRGWVASKIIRDASET